MKIYTVTLSVHHVAHMEAEDESEAKECMRVRCCREANAGDSFTIEAQPSTPEEIRENASNILRP